MWNKTNTIWSHYKGNLINKINKWEPDSNKEQTDSDQGEGGGG